MEDIRVRDLAIAFSIAFVVICIVVTLVFAAMGTTEEFVDGVKYLFD